MKNSINSNSEFFAFTNIAKVDNEIYEKINQAYSINYMCLKIRAQQIAYQKLKKNSQVHDNSTISRQSKSWFVGKKQQLAIERNYSFMMIEQYLEDKSYIFEKQLLEKQEILKMAIQIFFNENSPLEKYIHGFDILDERLKTVIFDDKYENKSIDDKNNLNSLILAYTTYENCLKEYKKFESLYYIFQQLQRDITEHGEKNENVQNNEFNIKKTNINNIEYLKCIVDLYSGLINKSLKSTNRDILNVTDELDYLNYITGRTKDIDIKTKIVYVFNEFFNMQSLNNPNYYYFFNNPTNDYYDKLINNKTNLRENLELSANRIEFHAEMIAELKECLDNLYLRFKFANMDKTTFGDRLKARMSGIPTRNKTIGLDISNIYIHQNEIDFINQILEKLGFEEFKGIISENNTLKRKTKKDISKQKSEFKELISSL